MSSEPIAPEADLPPLRIHHFLVWMAVTAMLITGTMWFDRTARNGPPIESRVVVGSLILLAVAVSGALTGVGWGLYWRGRGYAFPKEPGDWLLTWIAATIVCVLAMLIGVFVVFFIEEDWLDAFYFFGGLMLLIVSIRFGILGLMKYGDTAAWRVVFAVLAALPLIFLVAGAVAAACGVLASLLWAVWNDRRLRLRRHWMHWLGVIVVCSLACVMMGIGDR
jgi:hypothetical protein